jgi:hypothetical protein
MRINWAREIRGITKMNANGRRKYCPTPFILCYDRMHMIPRLIYIYMYISSKDKQKGKKIHFSPDDIFSLEIDISLTDREFVHCWTNKVIKSFLSFSFVQSWIKKYKYVQIRRKDSQVKKSDVRSCTISWNHTKNRCSWHLTLNHTMRFLQDLTMT